MAEQSLSNHTRFDPKFHYFLAPLALLCFIASIDHVVHRHTPADILLVPVTLVLLLTVGLARTYALKVQDRVIRLEETTRLGMLGAEAHGLTVKQFVALRFASDDEVAALARRARDERMEPKEIKKAIVHWRPDYDRL